MDSRNRHKKKAAKVLGGVVFALVLLCAIFISKPAINQKRDALSVVTPHQGDLSKQGGSATVRRPFVSQEDDPATSNDESNDQPVGHFGTVTLRVYNQQSGHEYTLDGEMNGTTLERLYFPKGGWVDFDDCELDDDLTGECEDEKGRTWEINGKH